MLAMGEEEEEDQLAHDNFFWEFPNLGAEEELPCIQTLAEITSKDNDNNNNKNSDGEEAVQVARGRKRRGGGSGGDDNETINKDEKTECDEHEMHIWTERERRKKMRNMFASLHALLPHLPPKADKTTIVDEAVNHIKKLQQTLEKLERQKLQQMQGHPSAHCLTIQSREAFLADQCSPVTLASTQIPCGPESLAVFKTWTSPNVSLSLCGHDAHFSLCSVRKPGLLTAVCFVLEKHKLEVVSAQASSDPNRCLYMIHARANVVSSIFLQAFSVEAICEQAAAEIILWINS